MGHQPPRTAHREHGPLYHGTTAAFESFRDTGASNGSPTGTLGTFLSADPRIASHFTLEPDVVDRGHDLLRGSRTLIADPWTVAGHHPFLPGARVLECVVAVNSLHVMSAVTWTEIVDDAPEPGGDVRLADFRAALIEAGHDGILIEAWDGSTRDRWGCQPCCEYDAATVCVFDRSKVTIVGEKPPGWAWLPNIIVAHPPLAMELAPRSIPPHRHPAFQRAMEVDPEVTSLAVSFICA
jgi:hypothetical protein